MIKKTRMCKDCIYWHSTGEKDYQGYCIISISCVNTPSRPRFVHKDDVSPVSEMRLKGGDNSTTGEMLFTDLADAKLHRDKIQPVYPDMRQLTDKSKKLLRKKRGGKKT